MLRRHFMTKAGYRPNVTITYHSEKPIVIKKDEYEVKLSDTGFDKSSSEFYTNYTTATITIISHDFSNGIGTIELNSRAKNFSDGTRCIGFGSAETFYDNGLLQYNDIFVSDVEITLFKISNITHINRIPQLVTKVIFPETLIGNVGILVNTPLVNKVVLPPYFNYKAEYPNEVSTSDYAANPNAEIIFTGDLYQRHSSYKNKNIKCPPHLVDKYKEYYSNATAANNILYIKKVTQDTDPNIKFSSDRNVDNELYITKYYANGYTEINIINYNDFESNSSNVGVFSDNGSGGNMNYNYITEIILPESITTLSSSFIGSNITKLTIPKNVTSISSYFFEKLLILEENLINLSSVDITTMPLYNKVIKNGIEENGCVIGDYIYNLTQNIVYKNTIHGVRDALYDNIIIPDYVECIKESAFYNSRIKYIFISKSINNITLMYNVGNPFSYTNCIIEVSEENKKYDSRDNCNAIVETENNKLICANAISTISNSIKIIGNASFYRVTYSKKVIDLKNVEIIEHDAFYDFDVADKIILNNTIVKLEENCLIHSSIKNIIYRGTIEEWNNIIIENNALKSGTIINCIDGDITV